MLTPDIPDDAPEAVISSVVRARTDMPSLICLVAWEGPDGIVEGTVTIRGGSYGRFYNRKLGVFIDIDEALENGTLVYEDWARELELSRKVWQQSKNRQRAL